MALAASTEPLSTVYDLAMLDLDGVVYRGKRAVPQAVEAIGAVHQAGMATAYLTNNASRTGGEVAELLRDIGLAAKDDEVVTAGEAIAHIVAESIPPGSKVLVVGGPGLIVPLERFGLRCVASADDQPAAVVQGFHPDVGWRSLAEASYAIEAGVPWFASNADRTIPTGRGIAPGNGSLIEAVRRATGATPFVAGKPERGLFDEALRRTGARRPLMVGDRLDTDISGALNCGIDAMHVLTGISDLSDVVAAPARERPHYVAPDLRALGQAHPPVEVSEHRSVCAGAVAEIDATQLELTAGSRGSLEATRAVVALAWAWRDSAGQVPRLTASALGH